MFKVRLFKHCITHRTKLIEYVTHVSYDEFEAVLEAFMIKNISML